MSAPLAGARVVAIIRLPQADQVLRAGQELAGAGLTAVEVTLTTPGALDAVARLRAELAGGCVIGAGSVRTVADVSAAHDAGAQFLVTPTTRVEVLAQARRLGLPVLAGALTPTEIDLAWSAGASAIKVFPASAFGPSYLREVRAPMPEIPLVPTGGVTPGLVADYAAAGAVAVAVGSALVSAELVAAGDWPALRRRVALFRRAAAEAWPEDRSTA
jgi:2-dehydro-3-deoxyphosphogluconate aldolase / (4S)-4-hydroxy-2-oxoglutarate aldolase